MSPRKSSSSSSLRRERPPFEEALARCRNAVEVHELLDLYSQRADPQGVEHLWRQVASLSRRFDRELVRGLCISPSRQASRVLKNPQATERARQSVFREQMAKLLGHHPKREGEEWVGRQVLDFVRAGYLTAASAEARALEEVVFSGDEEGHSRRLGAMVVLAELPGLDPAVLHRVRERPRDVFLWQVAARSSNAGPELWRMMLSYLADKPAAIITAPVLRAIGAERRVYEEPETRRMLRDAYWEQTREIAGLAPQYPPDEFAEIVAGLLERAATRAIIQPLKAALGGASEAQWAALPKETFSRLLLLRNAELWELSIRNASRAQWRTLDRGTLASLLASPDAEMRQLAIRQSRVVLESEEEGSARISLLGQTSLPRRRG